MMLKYVQISILIGFLCPGCPSYEKGVDNDPDDLSKERVMVLSLEESGSEERGKRQKDLGPTLDPGVENGQIKKLFTEDFEDGSFMDSGSCSGNCPEIIQDKNNRWLRARLNGSMDIKYRTELSLNTTSKQLIADRAYLLIFKVRFHRDKGQDFPRSMFVQAHCKNWLETTTNDFWESFVGRIDRSGSPTGFWQGEQVRGHKRTSPFNIVYGKWYLCHVLLQLSDGPKGRISVCRDGVSEFNEFGSNSGKWVHPQYLKFGIYTGKKNPVPEGTERAIDYDDIELYDITDLCSDTISPCDLMLGLE